MATSGLCLDLKFKAGRFWFFWGKLRMLNQYEGSAIAESNEGIGARATDNAAEQQDSLQQEKMSTAQMLYSVVAHNVENPDKRISLSPEQGKEIMKDFVDFVAGSDEPPTTEDGRIKTFGEMDDNELLKCLSDYLGSGASNSSINGTIIETAQEMIAEQYMTEEELEDLPDPKTPRGKELRDRKLLDKMRDAAEEQAAQSKWEKDVWANNTYDVGNLKLTGKQIDGILNALSDPQKRAKLAEDYKNKFGGTTADADKVLTDTEKYLKAKKRYEYLKATNQLDKMTPEEKADLELIKTNPKIEETVRFIEERNRANELSGVEIKASAENSQQSLAVRDLASRKESDDNGNYKVFRIGSSVATEYQDDGKSAIKTTVNPQAEFNPLGNPATAEVATANMNAPKIAPQVIVAQTKVVVASADMM